ncbi:MAG: helix-turn-helix domain-containing protein [Gammaproteobacteria bacterium]|nr:helix-turn-helix domain-containing protein [Gammaproteobacteria bacterium]
MTDRHDDLLTENDVAELFQISPRTVRQWRRRGMPSNGRAKRARRYRLHEIRSWASHNVRPWVSR